MKQKKEPLPPVGLKIGIVSVKESENWLVPLSRGGRFMALKASVLENLSKIRASQRLNVPTVTEDGKALPAKEIAGMLFAINGMLNNRGLDYKARFSHSHNCILIGRRDKMGGRKYNATTAKNA